ncbi:MAG TPA: hypothetical protein VF748_15005 [Candidatus Acidoferrum sp.]
MSIRNGVPLQFKPKGASDAIDSTNVFEGAMALLQNLIPDPTTADLWQCRPASLKLTGFSGFTAPGFISAMEVFGNFAYGMIASARNPGQDEPFMFNLVSKAFVTISGVTAANTPLSPPSTGAWTPPTISLVGVNLIVTHPGFNFGGGFAFGVLNISNPAAPTWTAQNTTGNALPALPTWVAAFNGRAWFGVNPATGQPGAYFTDILTLNITNANQVITFDDNQQITTASGLGLFNQLGGVVQALMVFKSTANIYQITGDAALSTLARNTLNVATGTLSPLSVTTTPKGLAFIAPDGLRLIDFYARITDPIGVDGAGINVPFIYSVVPSRAQAASNQNVLRVSVQNGLAAGAPQQEWWYDISRQKWSGPHTFPASMIAAFNNTFIMTPVGVNASLWQSDVAQSSSSSFVENGQQLNFSWATSMLPDPKTMSYFAMVETTLNMTFVNGQSPVLVQALDQNAGVLGSVSLSAPAGGTIWGQFTWGQALWGGASFGLFPRALEWAQPIVFRRLQLQATGVCIGGFKIGDAFLRYQKLGYMVVDPASAVLPVGTLLTTEGGVQLTTEGGTGLAAG